MAFDVPACASTASRCHCRWTPVSVIVNGRVVKHNHRLAGADLGKARQAVEQTVEYLQGALGPEAWTEGMHPEIPETKVLDKRASESKPDRLILRFDPKGLQGTPAGLRFTVSDPSFRVDLKNTGDWIKAGAACVGVGSALVSKDALAKNDWNAITASAKAFVDAVKKARAGA